MSTQNEKPVLLNQEMVRALLDGAKLQTRRPMTKKLLAKMRVAAEIGEISYFMDNGFLHENDESYIIDFSPLGKVGDRLYVRETARLIEKSVYNYNPDNPRMVYRFKYLGDSKSDWVFMPERIKPIKIGHCCSNGCFKELARIWLEITGVSVERVQSISREDIMSEGVRDDNPMICGGMAVHDIHVLDNKWQTLWNSCYPGSWERNDWVFVYDFKRTEQ
ncbi:hypothetical protein KAR91_60120 [Candidatus Pacearchaeota archaeon]|nr:hypothetical protein [Candidatus Pacearchaeota archaeon]